MNDQGDAATRTRWRIRLACPDVGPDEVVAVTRVLSGPVLTGGPETARFEQRFARRHDVAEAVAFANGTVALAAIQLALGIGPGDEVIVPSLTFVSTATSVLHVGATPIFADVLRDTFTLDPDDIARRITPRTRAVIAVHYGGQAADIDELRALAARSGIDLIEDAAEAHGATYRGRPVGGLGRAAMFSFTPTKNMTTGEGGMVTTNDAGLADQLRLLRNHGQTATYRHDVLGYNWRLTEMQAAMGVAQLEKLDSILRRKRHNATWMSTRLGTCRGVTPPAVRADRDHVFMLYTLRLGSRRDTVAAALGEAGIESKVYFPPVHRQPIFADRAPVDLPVTDELASEILSIPMHSRLTTAELDEIARVVEQTFSAQKSIGRSD